jgi:formate hydrogenlyase subunit 6/NADH:ubiquinone oxidoreductase subunit I
LRRFLPEMFRGMALTMKYFFEPKVTVRPSPMSSEKPSQL